jgi:putative transposase
MTSAVHQAYRFALDPTPRQQCALASALGGARFAYNWGLELVKQRLDACAAGQQVEVPWILPALRREWNRAKHQVAPWWADNSKEAYSSGLDGLARALKNWAGSGTDAAAAAGSASLGSSTADAKMPAGSPPGRSVS